MKIEIRLLGSIANEIGKNRIELTFNIDKLTISQVIKELENYLGNSSIKDTHVIISQHGEVVNLNYIVYEDACFTMLPKISGG